VKGTTKTAALVLVPLTTMGLAGCNRIESVKEMHAACSDLRLMQTEGNKAMAGESHQDIEPLLDSAIAHMNRAVELNDNGPFKKFATDLSDTRDSAQQTGSLNIIVLSVLLDQCDTWGA
jgi:hypothetical protein